MTIGVVAVFLILCILAMLRNHISKAQRQALTKLPDYISHIEAMRDTYIDNKNMEAFLNEVKADAQLIKRLPRRILKRPDVFSFLDIYNNFPEKVKSWNENYIKVNSAPVAKELAESLGATLDEQQMRAVLTDEVNNLVIAGAGSGKTLTICGKAIFLVNRKCVNPSRILLLAFNRSAANELSDKLKSKGCHVNALTFHKLGLEIIKEARKSCPDVVGDDFLPKAIRNYLCSLNENDIADIRNILNYLGIYRILLDSEENYEVAGDYYEHISDMEFETLRSQYNRVQHEEHLSLKCEKLRSVEETVIANFLFLHGVEYEYEKRYPYQIMSYYGSYHPDFYLPKYDIYIEHFGINREGNVPWLPPIEEERYKDGIRWKREVHKSNGTKLIESYSYWKTEGVLEANLDKMLRENGVVYSDVDYLDIYRAIIAATSQEHDFDEFCKMIGTFIHLYKERPDSSFVELRKQAQREKKPFDRNRAIAFLDMVEPIYYYYQNELQKVDAIDFSDMINLAAKYVREKQFTRKYDYIIIDEFQDISYSRYNLIRAIRDATDAKTFCVGDDWQSIYRFAGSEIDFLVHFSSYFGYSETSRIERTYRYSQELIDVIEPFVLKNQYQLQKKMISGKHQTNPVRLVPYVGDVQEALFSALDSIVSDIQARKETISNKTVLLLARNMYDLNRLMGRNFTEVTKRQERFRLFSYADCKELRIIGTTVHKSKGAEADYVIIVRAENSRYGFPNKLADDPIFQLLRPNVDSYPFAEERRLFYVAITRTKRISFVLVPEQNPSEFISELIQSTDVATGLLPNDSETNKTVPCPRCLRGHLVLRKNSATGADFLGCSLYPSCSRVYSDTTLLSHAIKCKKCGGYMVHRQGYSTFLGCSNYPFCKYTIDIPADSTKGQARRKA